MTNVPRYATLRDYLRVLRDYRVVIVVTTLVFAGAAYAISKRATASYQAQASIALSDPTRDQNLAGVPASATTPLPEDQPTVNAATIASPSIINMAASIVSKNRPYRRLTASDVQALTSARVAAQTNLVIVQASSGDPRLAQYVANAVATADVNVVTADVRNEIRTAALSLRSRLGTLFRTANSDFLRASYVDSITRLRSLAQFAQPAQVAAYASLPSSPVSPKPTRNAILAGLVGLTLAIVFAFMRASLDRRLHGAAQIQQELGLPVMGRVRDEALGRAGPLGNGRKPMTPGDLEAFRILRANLGYLDTSQPLRSYLVTSPLAQEGKSTVALALAFATAWSGRRTLLIECDLRQPSVAARTPLESQPGLSELLAGNVTLEQAIQRVRLPGAPVSSNGQVRDAGTQNTDPGGPEPLAVITAGQPPSNPAELLGSQRFRTLLAEASSMYEAVVLDSAPLLSVADTLEIVPQVDGILLCVRVAQTTRDEARAAKQALENLPSRPTGLVITGVRAGDEVDYGYYASASA